MNTLKTVERRRHVLTIKRLLILNLIAIVLGLSGIGVGIVAATNQIDDIQHSRAIGAVDTCEILRTLVQAAYTRAHQLDGIALLTHVGLGNCVTYSHNLLRAGSKNR